jgi:hypothetical protein
MIQEILKYGAYICLRPAAETDRRHLAAAAIPALAEHCGLQNEFAPGAGPPRDSIAFLRRRGATPADIADQDLLHAEWVIHVVAKASEPVAEFTAGACKLLEPATRVRILEGVARPRSYTSAAMDDFAYARAVVQQPGAVMPNAFLVPMSKTSEWWRKGWMERHTYFLPRYDDEGRMRNEGHALAAEAGIACLMRRTYHAETQPAPDGAYDFLTYFECADDAVPVFHQVCAALRDVKRNPEWKFVREGPTWHGRRVSAWTDLFAE